MPVPFAGEMACLQALTREAHPQLGHGLQVRLTLPRRATEVADAATAGELNRLEFASRTLADVQGAWLAASGELHHVTFLPNLAWTGDDDAIALLRSGLERARWAADLLA